MLRRHFWSWLIAGGCMLACSAGAQRGSAEDIVHDAEYYILEAQNGERWEAEDRQLDARLAELRRKHGAPPNIIHIMWDDTAFGDVGIPAIQKVRGLQTPNLNRMAKEGILFTRMYTEVGCTPSRAACMTGRYAVRSGMYNIGMLRESHGMRGEEVTLAEVLSAAGYATAFHGKWHLGDIEESYPHNQGFDEALFTPMNQIVSQWNRTGDAVGAARGFYPDNYPPNPYRLDDPGLLPTGLVMAIEGRKGEQGQEWRTPTVEAFGLMEKDGVLSDGRPIILDSGCGTGSSTQRLAEMFPRHLVIGVDRSLKRLEKSGFTTGFVRSGNFILLRGELATFWRLLLNSGCSPERHYLLYPNPSPKPGHLSRRWHGHPVFPQLLSLGGEIELRCNWEIYAQEFAEAVSQATGADIDVLKFQPVEAISPFEQKYAERGQSLYSVTVPARVLETFRLSQAGQV